MLKIEWKAFEKRGHITLCLVDIVTRFSQIKGSLKKYVLHPSPLPPIFQTGDINIFVHVGLISCPTFSNKK